MTSIDRIHRLLQIVDLLQSGRQYNSTQLATECDVTRRTIYRDLKILQDSGIHVQYDESRQCYKLPRTMFLPPTDFSLDEVLSLIVLCCELGGHDSGLPLYQSASNAALKLLSIVPQQLRDYVGDLTDRIEVKIGPVNPLTNAGEHYERIRTAIQARQPLRIDYESFSDRRDITTLLKPYRMLFDQRSWYVIGRSSIHRANRTFNIGRIRKSTIVDGSYSIPPRFNLDRYLGNAWRLIRDTRHRNTDVVIRFQPLVARNVAEVQWHKTQKLVWNDDGTLDFHVRVDGLGEIVWWILGYGNQAEVLQPDKLRQMMREHVQAMSQLYADGPSTTQ